MSAGDLELQYMSFATVTLVVSSVEVKEIAARAPAAEVRIVSNIHELQPTQPDRMQLVSSSRGGVGVGGGGGGSGGGGFGRAGVVFTGNFNHLPNRDAVLWFAKEILPLVVGDPRLVASEQQELAAAGGMSGGGGTFGSGSGSGGGGGAGGAVVDERRFVFHVVGANAIPAAILALNGSSIDGVARVLVHGFVEDLRSFYASRRVSVVPIRWGAGVKGKVNSAMSFGVPVVCTTVAEEGECS